MNLTDADSLLLFFTGLWHQIMGAVCGQRTFEYTWADKRATLCFVLFSCLVHCLRVSYNSTVRHYSSLVGAGCVVVRGWRRLHTNFHRCSDRHHLGGGVPHRPQLLGCHRADCVLHQHIIGGPPSPDT